MALDDMIKYRQSLLQFILKGDVNICIPKYMMFHPAVIDIETDMSGSHHGGEKN